MTGTAESPQPPLVSIGVPTYNRARFLARTLDGILAQTWSNLEIVVSDNGSTDDTEAVASAYAARDPRIRYVRQERNLGFAGNLQATLDLARGTYFMWHADDDLAHPGFVERTVAYLEANPDVVSCGTEYEFVDEQGRFLRAGDMSHLHADQPWTEAQRAFFSFPEGRSVMLVYGMHRTAALREVGAPETQTFRDILSGIETPFLARLSTKGRIVVLPEVLFSYTEHPNDKASIAHTGSRLARWELPLLYLTIGAKLTASAARVPAPLRQRARLAATCWGGIARRAGDRLARVGAPTPPTARDLSRRPAVVAALVTLLATAALYALSPSWEDVVRRLGAEVPVEDIFAEYRFAILWAGVLGAGLWLVPLRRRERVHLSVAWLAKVFVVLGPMLLYEATYTSLDSHGYYKRALEASFPEGGLLSGTDNVARLAWLHGQVVPVSFHALKVSWAFVGLAACYVLWRAGVRFVRSDDARIFYAVALFPSVLFWSSILGKDPLVLLGLALSAFAAVAFHERRWARGVVAAVVGIAILLIVRPWLVAMVLVPIPLPILARAWRGSVRARVATLGAVVGLAVAAVWIVSSLFDVTSVSGVVGYINGVSRAWAYGGSGQTPPVFGGVFDLLVFLPLGGFTALFRPLPGEISTSVFAVLAGLENGLLLAIVAWAAWRARWKDVRHPLVVAALLYVAVWTTLYAFVSYQNLGSAFRFRLQVVPLVLGLAAWFGRPARSDGPHVFVGLAAAIRRNVVRGIDAACAAVVLVVAVVRLLPGAFRRPRGTTPRLLSLDTSYTLHAVRTRGLKHAFTSQRLDGYFEHVWVAHPLVGAAKDEPPENAIGPSDEAALAPGITFVQGRIAYTGSSRFPLTDFARAQANLWRRLARIVRDGRVTVVRASDPYYVGLVGLLFARLHRIPFVVRVGGNYDAIFAQLGTPAYPRLFGSRAREKVVERFVFRRADLVAAANEDNLRFALTNGARPERSTVFRYGTLIDPVHFTDPRTRRTARRVREALGLGDRRYLVYVGRLEAVKHAEDVVHVLAALAKERTDLCAVLVGDGRTRADILALAERLGVGGRVVIAGNRDQAFVAEALAGASAVVSPHMGRALVEAALSGTPIAAYDHDWQGEIVETGKTGELVPFKDVRALSEATRRLFDDPARAEVLGRNARDRARAMMDPDTLRRRERAAYDALLPASIRRDGAATSATL